MTELEIQINYGLIGKMNEAIAGRDESFANLKLIPNKVSFAQYGKLFIDNPKYLTMFWIPCSWWCRSLWVRLS
ncbi:hypothetical protein J14TS5_46660 [Paenibacillus lautus]|nr:hypothetical protein J14TS5_46660 [Paenibacillus lautus]